MKNTLKWLGIITLVVVIGFSTVACEFGDDENGNNGGNGGSTNRTITIRNNTGYSIGGIYYYYIKPSTSSDWGSGMNLPGYTSINNGESYTLTLPARITNNGIYDIIFHSSSGKFTKYYFTITNGMTITFTQSDYDDDSQNPRITIQNLSGVHFDCFVKPSSASDWGVRLGSINNNGSTTITLPFRLVNFNVFDIQMRSSNPTNTYTKNNITVSNGMTIIYSPNDTDNPSIISPVVIIQNNTGYSIGGIYYYYIKPSSSSDWGAGINLPGYTSINNGASYALTLPARIINNNMYDIIFHSSSGSFTKTGVSLSFGMTITFTSSDAD